MSEGNGNYNPGDNSRRREGASGRESANGRSSKNEGNQPQTGNQQGFAQQVYQLPQAQGGYYPFSSSGQATYTLMGDARWGGSNFTSLSSHPVPPPRLAHMNQPQSPRRGQQHTFHTQPDSVFVGPGGDFVRGSRLPETAIPPGYGLIQNHYNYIFDANLAPSTWPSPNPTFIQASRSPFGAPGTMDTNPFQNRSAQDAAGGGSRQSLPSNNAPSPPPHHVLVQPPKTEQFLMSNFPPTHNLMPEPRAYHHIQGIGSPTGFSGAPSAANISQTFSGLSLSSSLAGSNHNSPHSTRNGNTQDNQSFEPQSNRTTDPDDNPHYDAKPLTWAEKVKQTSKDAIPKLKPRVPIGGVGSRSKVSASTVTGAAGVSCPGNLISQRSSKSFAINNKDNGVVGVTSSKEGQYSPPPTLGSMGWGKVCGSGKVVSARKPAGAAPIPPPVKEPNTKDSNLQNAPHPDGAVPLGTEEQKAKIGGGTVEMSMEEKKTKGIQHRDSSSLQKLKMETNPHDLSVINTRGARYFVIKSYSEDDVHRSIKYGIWCSTPVGNRRLDSAFKTANGPILLFFSVNASGHFCGIAQMTSDIDYNTQSQVWLQGKWKGLFHVRWLYVKDVPNGHLRHIRLENNEDKPVTNSRDTQEVPPEKGRILLRCIHQYKHNTSLFDDFSHYEQRQVEEETTRQAA